jgi:ubiquinone/menaquinone biosynthesis C-methylase UbiE
MTGSDQEPLINPNKSLQSYYASLESRIGYRLVLGGRRHFGYYDKDIYWPFPINGALRAIEDHLFDTLGARNGAQVLDAGCGDGYVAIHLAKRGLRMQGIDVVDRHLKKAHRNIKAAGLENAITVRKMDYHHLDSFADDVFDGAYTMETFVHATDPEVALAEFYRVLKPGGTMALYEYDHSNLSSAPSDIRKSMDQINEYASMPANARFDKGVLEKMMLEVGFVDVVVRDLTTNVTPMLRLFFVLAYIPFLIVKLLGLQAWFVNTVAGVEAYRGREFVRYVAVSAKKPSATSAIREGLRERKK